MPCWCHQRQCSQKHCEFIVYKYLKSATLTIFSGTAKLSSCSNFPEFECLMSDIVPGLGNMAKK